MLEHLATFSVSPENDLVYPADGMRRLLSMEKTNGIWTQKMMMRIERKMVNIMDHENKDIVEQFPLGLVREPTAFTSNDPKELYNNILIYIVGHPQEESPIPSEMHIFQCVNVRARDVVEDLKGYMSGRRNYGRRSAEIEVGDLPPFGVQSEVDGPGGRMQAQLLESGSKKNYDDTSSTSSDKYEKDVTILNRCFDDIEKFIARLQHAAAAFRELEKRRRSRKSKKKDLGDGMLSMRAKPPPEREFVDIFQKFKLSFNLLAKLKAHIHDPNAPELVHFLFTPLALIVDASHDSHYGPNLPSKVVAPLLTGNAVELLINCLTSKENELWHSLGEPWYVPSEGWKGYVSPYRPVFMDGWSPSYVEGGTGNGRDDDELNEDYELSQDERRSHPYGYDQGPPNYSDVDRSPDLRKQRYDNRAGAFPPMGRRDSDVSADSSDRNNGHNNHPNSYRFDSQQRAFLEELATQGCKVVQVTYPRTANNDKELTVVRGEFLEVLDNSRKWWKTRNVHGQIGHVPHTIVTESFETGGGSRGKASRKKYY